MNCLAIKIIKNYDSNQVVDNGSDRISITL